MATIKSAIIAVNPLCTPNFLKDKSALALDHIWAYYKEREENIDAYIKLLKDTYLKYGYDNPFTDYGKEDQRFINADFSTETMQKKIKIVNRYEPSWSKGIGEAIDEYIVRRTKKYFGPNEVLDFSYKNYFYLLALDETVYSLYKENQKYLDKAKSNFTHADLVKDYVEILLGIRQRNYEEPQYITQEEQEAMGLEELPPNYIIDDFLGPKGPGR